MHNALRMLSLCCPFHIHSICLFLCALWSFFLRFVSSSALVTISTKANACYHCSSCSTYILTCYTLFLCVIYTIFYALSLKYFLRNLSAQSGEGERARETINETATYVIPKQNANNENETDIHVIQINCHRLLHFK